MLAPELHAELDTPVLDEYRAVLVPVEFLLRRAVQLREQVFLPGDAGKQFDEFALGVIGLVDHALDESADVVAALIITAGELYRPRQRRGQHGDQQYRKFLHQTRNRFAERIDMIRPNPTISVTIDVPP